MEKYLSILKGSTLLYSVLVIVLMATIVTNPFAWIVVGLCGLCAVAITVWTFNCKSWRDYDIFFGGMPGIFLLWLISMALFTIFWLMAGDVFNWRCIIAVVPAAWQLVYGLKVRNMINKVK